jgi:hypothetical protein
MQLHQKMDLIPRKKVREARTGTNVDFGLPNPKVLLDNPYRTHQDNPGCTVVARSSQTFRATELQFDILLGESS